MRGPIPSVLVAANEDAKQRPAMLNRVPYGAGRMVRARPTHWEAERDRLVGAERYRVHVRRAEPAAEFL